MILSEKAIDTAVQALFPTQSSHNNNNTFGHQMKAKSPQMSLARDIPLLAEY